jgi:hypothetical protein
MEGKENRKRKKKKEEKKYKKRTSRMNPGPERKPAAAQ